MMIEDVHQFCTSIFNQIFEYLEYTLHTLLNDTGNSIPLNATSTELSMTAIEPVENIPIYKNETCQQNMYHYTKNDHSSKINNKLKKKETLQKKINLESRNTDPGYYYNDIETPKTTINSSCLYNGIFYENMKCNEMKIKEDEQKKLLFFESMRQDIMGRTRRFSPKAY